MKLEKSLSSYPVLSVEDDDYIDSIFDAEVEKREDFGKIIIKANFILKNEGLYNLINSGYAKFVLHVECPTMSERLIYYSDTESVEAAINMDDLDDNIEISTFIVVIKDIFGYSNVKFNYDYGGATFNLKKGNILAIGPNYTLKIDRSNKSYQKLPDILQIVEDDKSKGEFTVDCSRDVIYVYVNKSEKNSYINKGKRFKNSVLSMIMVPVMVNVLCCMQKDKGLKENAWYKIVNAELERNNIDIDNLEMNGGENSIFVAAQKIFKVPLEKGLDEVGFVEEEDE